MEKMAQWLERDYPSAARSLREGLEESVHDPPAGATAEPASLPGDDHLIESPQSGVRKRTGNVCRWREEGMVMRWVAGAYLLTEKNFHKIAGYEQLWTLAGALGRSKKSVTRKEKYA